MSRIELRFASEVHNQFGLQGPENLYASIRGLVVERVNKGKTQFLQVRDVTGVLQVILEKENFGEKEYEEKCKSIRKGDIISTHGVIGVGRSSGIASIIPNEPPEIVPIEAENTVELDSLPYMAVGSRVIQAKIINSIRRFFEQDGSLEIEPRLIQTEWTGAGLEPLRAEYPGFGHNVFLTPSPLPQIFEALISTGRRSIFAIGKCFTTSYRDVHSSTEATAIFLVERRASGPTASAPYWDSALRCLRNLFAQTETALPAVTAVLQEDGITEQVRDWPNLELGEHNLIIQRVRRPQFPSRLDVASSSSLEHVEILEFARIALRHEGKVYTLGECTLEVRFNALRVVCTTIQTEHLLDLLSTAPFRSLRTSTFWSE